MVDILCLFIRIIEIEKNIVTIDIQINIIITWVANKRFYLLGDKIL